MEKEKPKAENNAEEDAAASDVDYVSDAALTGDCNKQLNHRSI